MRSLLTVFTILNNRHFLLAAFIWGWFEISFLPSPMFIFFLLIAMLIDLISGLLKSWKVGLTTSTEGFHKTVFKMGVYFCVISASFVLANQLKAMNQWFDYKVNYGILINSVIGFLTFVEIYSVFDNVDQVIDKNSILSRFFIAPVLKFLRGKLKRNPFSNLENPTNDEQ